jgi:hypothetical protein
MTDGERDFHLRCQPLCEVTAIGQPGQRIFARLTLELEAALAQCRDQPLLFRARLLQLVGPLGHAGLQAQAIILQIFEGTRIHDCGRDLRGELLHQMQVRLRIHAGLGVLDAEQARHDATLDQRHDDDRAGLLAGRFRALPQLRRRA